MWDTLATEIAVFIVSMGSPSAITQQLQEKYTHEIFVYRKGKAKYDVVDWQQNYRGWQARQNKDWDQSFNFKMVPHDVYVEYDEMRVSVTQELKQLVKDKMADSEALSTMRRMHDIDFEFLQILYNKGGVNNEWVNQEENRKYKDALTRCKARSLAVPLRKGTSYWYDLTDFGMEILKIKETTEPQDKEIVKPLKF